LQTPNEGVGLRPRHQFIASSSRSSLGVPAGRSGG
jgi:hypothetical protein